MQRANCARERPPLRGGALESAFGGAPGVDTRADRNSVLEIEPAGLIAPARVRTNQVQAHASAEIGPRQDVRQILGVFDCDARVIVGPTRGNDEVSTEERLAAAAGIHAVDDGSALDIPDVELLD